MNAALVLVRAAAAARSAAFAPLDTAVIAAVLLVVVLAARWQRHRLDRSRPSPSHPTSDAGSIHDRPGTTATTETTETTETTARR